MQHTLLGLRHIPLDDVRLRDTNILSQLHGAVSTTTKLYIVRCLICDQIGFNTHSSNHKHLRGAAGLLLSSFQRLLDRLDQKILVGIGFLSRQGLALRVSQLPCPVLDGQSGTCIDILVKKPEANSNHGYTHQHNQQTIQKLSHNIISQLQ